MLKSIFTRVFAVVAAVAVMGLAGCKDNAEAKPEITSLSYSIDNSTLTINGKNFGSTTSDVTVLMRYVYSGPVTAAEAQKAGMVSFDGAYFYAYTPSNVTSSVISVNPGYPCGDYEVRIIVKSFTAVAPNTITIENCAR